FFCLVRVLFLMRCPPPRSPLFPYTTLFRSVVPYGVRDLAQAGAKVGDGGDPEGDAVWERVRPGGPDAASGVFEVPVLGRDLNGSDRKSTRLNSSHRTISYAVFCLKKKKHTY